MNVQSIAGSTLEVRGIVAESIEIYVSGIRFMDGSYTRRLFESIRSPIVT